VIGSAEAPELLDRAIVTVRATWPRRAASSPPFDHQDASVAFRPRCERLPRHGLGQRHVEVLEPPPRPRRGRPGPSPGGLILQDEAGRQEPAVRLQEPPQQRGSYRKWRAGDDVIRSPRKAEIGGVGLDHDDALVAETLPERLGPAAMGLDRDNPGAAAKERFGDRASPGADVEDEGALWERCVEDEPFSPTRIELMPAPRSWGGHGGGPS